MNLLHSKHAAQINKKPFWLSLSFRGLKKRLDFYTSKRSISRSGHVMKGKTELLMNLK
jgi:hypothetical protein